MEKSIASTNINIEIKRFLSKEIIEVYKTS